MLLSLGKDKPKERPSIEVKYEGGAFWNKAGGKVDVCEWCGCVHAFFCPRIKTVNFFPSKGPDGQPLVERIEFWEHESRELWATVVELVPLEDDPTDA